MTKRQPKQFGTTKAQPVEESEIGFVLGEQSYVCKPQVQGAVILDFISAADDSNVGAASRIMPFFKKVLTESEYKRFDAQVNGDDEIIEMETLSEIVGYLIEEYTTGRPTQASSSSEDGS